MKIMTVGQLIEGLKYYDPESDVTIFDNNNDEQYDVSFVIEDEEKNLQVMIVFEGNKIRI
jgi:hypothetical protein